MKPPTPTSSNEPIIVEVVRVSAAATHPLRRSVLRSGTASGSVEWDSDDDETTLHLAAIADGRIVGVSTWLRAEQPSSGDAVDSSGAVAGQTYRLRGMAVADDCRGRNVGDQLLAGGIEAMALRQAEHLWANARITALGFYRRAGWDIAGPEFVDTTTGLPHVTIVRSVP